LHHKGGCFCPQGLFLQNNACVPQESCRFVPLGRFVQVLLLIKDDRYQGRSQDFSKGGAEVMEAKAL